MPGIRFGGLNDAILPFQHSHWNSTPLYFWVLAQKCLKPSVNGVLKFQFFFLNLSSKVLAGVGVRTSKYPYMDICVLRDSVSPVCKICLMDF